MAAPAQSMNIEFINEQERQYFAEAVLGEDIRSFLVSTVGRFLHGRAKAVYDKCVDEVFALDPYTAEGKRERARLMADAWAAKHFMQWCSEAMQGGDIAATQLESYRDNLGE